MNVLVVTKIFPNRNEPLSAPFNRQQFRALGNLCNVEVLATIPYFPGIGLFKRQSAAGRLTGVPETEVIDGMVVHHPRFLYLPKLGHGINGTLYAASLAVPAWLRRRNIDVIVGSWAYPDGYAAVRLGEALGIPSVVKLHGSDLNVVAKMPGPRRALRRVLPRAERVIAVSHPLKREAQALGVRADRIDVVMNGVDRRVFHPRDRGASRRKLRWRGPDKIILYVGRLEREKGVLELLEAFERGFASRRDVALVLVGEGSREPECDALSRRLDGRVVVAGAQPLDEVATWLGASDLLTLPSHNEGTPNVVLEALACGRRVVASRVGGIPDLLHTPSLGALVPPRDAEALSSALSDAVCTSDDPESVVAEAGVGGWEQSAGKLHRSLVLATESFKRLHVRTMDCIERPRVWGARMNP